METNNNERPVGMNNRPMGMFGRKHTRKEEDRYLKLRNVLNIVFLVLAIPGMIVYFYYEQVIGTIIILIAMMFKMVECVFRFMK